MYVQVEHSFLPEFVVALLVRSLLFKAKPTLVFQL